MYDDDRHRGRRGRRGEAQALGSAAALIVLGFALIALIAVCLAVYSLIRAIAWVISGFTAQGDPLISFFFSQQLQ
jgi:hypothetical protein